MKRFLILPTLILAILFGCSEVNENIDTNSGHYEDNASNVANTISKLSPGIYTINVFGEINPVTISNIKAAMINNPKAKISLDLSNTTGLLGIESEAFMGCDNLINITIPNNIGYIGNHAFSSCNNLINITIPDSVTLIQSNAFNSCNSLTSIIIPNGVTDIGNNAFSYCQNLTNISIPDSVTHIGYNAFSYCTNLTNISIPNSITSIEYSTFSYCTNLTNITIPNSVTYIDNDAFTNCNNLKSVTFENTTGWYHSDNEDNTDLMPINVTNESDNAAYLRNIHTGYWYRKITITTTANNIENIIPKHLIGIYTICINGEIDAITLYNIKTIVTDNYEAQISLDLSNTTGLTKINNEIFSNFYNLTNIILPNSITYIGDSAFSDCSSLENIIIPDSVTFIGNTAFEYCDNLKNVTFENTNDWYYSNEDNTDLTLINVTNESDNATYLRNIHTNYWYRKNIINTTTNDIKNAISELPAGLYTINVNGEINTTTIANIKTAIINNTNAQISLDLSNTTGLQEIDNEAFSGCYNLTNIIFPNSVTTIGDSAFEYCGNLENVTIGSGVTTIGTNAFKECNNLKSVTFENTNDWYYSNEDNTDLTLINVTNESDNATYLRNIHTNYWYRKNIINTTTNDIKNTTYNLPAGLYTININGEINTTTIANIKAAIIDNSNAKIFLDLSNTTGLLELDSESFSGCHNLTNIILPNTVTYIGDRAFYSCYNLESIIIPDSVTSIGESAFGYCYKLTSVTFADTTSTWYYTSSSSYTDGTAIDVTDAATNATNLTKTYYSKYWYKKASSIE